MTLRTRLIFEWLIIALLATAMIIAFQYYRTVERFDLLIYDFAMEWQGASPSGEILIVKIDEDSLAELGGWPWTRDTYAPALDNIANGGASAIALDVLFTENAGTAQENQALADALARNARTILPLQLQGPGLNGRRFDKLKPLKPLEKAAVALGHVNLDADNDTVIRRLNLCVETDGEKIPYLILATLSHKTGKTTTELAGEDCETPKALPFMPQSDFKTVSFAQVANGQIPSQFFDDKMVLIGATAAGLGDQHRTPAVNGALAPGIVVMANALEALIQNNFISNIPFISGIILSLMPLWILLIILWRARPRTVIIIAILLIAAILLVSVALFQMQIWFPPVTALIAIALVYPLWGWRRLQATSDYMGRELSRMDAGVAVVPPIDNRRAPADIVTEQAERLAMAIRKLRDMRRFVTDTLEHLPDPMLVTDQQGNVVMNNHVAEELLGNIGDNMAIKELLAGVAHKQDFAALSSYLSDAMSENTADIEYHIFKTRNGHHFAVRCAPILSDQNENLGHILYFADITTIRLANQQREEVLQLLSHDMRGPQAAILALLDRGDKAKEKPAVEPDIADRIRLQAKRTLSLADNFVDMARMKAQKFEPEDVLFADLVAEAAEALWPQSSSRDIRINIEDESDAAFIAGERSSLSRAFINLFDNAVKYSPKGSEISVTIDHLELGKERFVRCMIDDQGEGINKNILPRLFGRFASTNDSVDQGPSGIGLGLHYVKTVIERHEGDIQAENLKQGGARFIILLSALDDEDLE
jgi:PAS domain S-box-containing protein